MMSPQLHVAMMDARTEEEIRRAAARRDPLRALREARAGKPRRAPKVQRVRAAGKRRLSASFQG
jgi:hypothetical protein